MKFLLSALNAKYIHSNPAIFSLRAYVGESLQEHVELAEYTINNQLQDILADLYKRKPDVIAFSCYIWNWKMIQELLVVLPKVLPHTDLWLGGPEVSYNAAELMEQYPQLTGIMVGEGEEIFKVLLESYVYPSEQGNKKGILMAKELVDISKLPFLYDNLELFTNRIIYYETSRGCPYRCSYCLSSIDKAVRLRDIEVVKKELQFFLDQKVKQVKFIDRTFNCNHNHAMAIWQYLYEHDNGITNFHFEISADILREDEIALLQKLRPGLAQLEIGVQSVNEKTIDAIRRVMDVERLEKKVAAIHKGHNIHMHLDLIAGLPFEDYDSFGKSFDRVYSMKPEQLQLGFLKVLKGSEMYEKAEEFGITYLDLPPYEVLHTKWLPYEDVLRLKQIEEMVELYYNSNQFVHTLPFLETAFEGPFDMFEALARFYDENHFFTNSPARAYRYQLLLSFAEEKDPNNLAIYKELLTYDMYLRENLKSRPVFAEDLSEKKEITEEIKNAIRNFYREEEQTRKWLPSYERYDWKQLSKMTHLEHFEYPVWMETEELMAYVSCREDTYKTVQQGVLFDYNHRDPLTYEAHTQLVKLKG